MEQSKYLFNAACYCRLSKDDENDGTSVSIESQIQILSDFCRDNNLKIFDFYCDDGFTGTNFDRPSYKRMMSDIDKNLINTIVVKDLSRFGRNYIEVGKHIEEIFPEKGVRFIAIGDDVDTEKDNMDLDLLLPMKNIFNQFYYSFLKIQNKPNAYKPTFPLKKGTVACNSNSSFNNCYIIFFDSF